MRPGLAKGSGFGFALAAGDFNQDGYPDLAIAAPFNDGGSVTMMFGTSSGLNMIGAQVWTLDSLGVPGIAQPGDNFAGPLSPVISERAPHRFGHRHSSQEDQKR